MTFVERLAAYLKDRSNTWVNGLERAKIAGVYAWRSRISDCRIGFDLDGNHAMGVEWHVDPDLHDRQYRVDVL